MPYELTTTSVFKTTATSWKNISVYTQNPCC